MAEVGQGQSLEELIQEAIQVIPGLTDELAVQVMKGLRETAPAIFEPPKYLKIDGLKDAITASLKATDALPQAIVATILELCQTPAESAVSVSTSSAPANAPQAPRAATGLLNICDLEQLIEKGAGVGLYLDFGNNSCSVAPGAISATLQGTHTDLLLKRAGLATLPVRFRFENPSHEPLETRRRMFTFLNDRISILNQICKTQSESSVEDFENFVTQANASDRTYLTVMQDIVKRFVDNEDSDAFVRVCEEDGSDSDSHPIMELSRLKSVLDCNTREEIYRNRECVGTLGRCLVPVENIRTHACFPALSYKLMLDNFGRDTNGKLLDCFATPEQLKIRNAFFNDDENESPKENDEDLFIPLSVYVGVSLRALLLHALYQCHVFEDIASNTERLQSLLMDNPIKFFVTCPDASSSSYRYAIEAGLSLSGLASPGVYGADVRWLYASVASSLALSPVYYPLLGNTSTLFVMTLDIGGSSVDVTLALLYAFQVGVYRMDICSVAGNCEGGCMVERLILQARQAQLRQARNPMNIPMKYGLVRLSDIAASVWPNQVSVEYVTTLVDEKLFASSFGIASFEQYICLSTAVDFVKHVSKAHGQMDNTNWEYVKGLAALSDNGSDGITVDDMIAHTRAKEIKLVAMGIRASEVSKAYTCVCDMPELLLLERLFDLMFDSPQSMIRLEVEVRLREICETFTQITPALKMRLWDCVHAWLNEDILTRCWSVVCSTNTEALGDSQDLDKFVAPPPPDWLLGMSRGAMVGVLQLLCSILLTAKCCLQVGGAVKIDRNVFEQRFQTHMRGAAMRTNDRFRRLCELMLQALVFKTIPVDFRLEDGLRGAASVAMPVEGMLVRPNVQLRFRDGETKKLRARLSATGPYLKPFIINRDSISLTAGVRPSEISRALVGVYDGVSMKDGNGALSSIELYWTAKDVMGAVREEFTGQLSLPLEELAKLLGPSTDGGASKPFWIVLLVGQIRDRIAIQLSFHQWDQVGGQGQLLLPPRVYDAMRLVAISTSTSVAISSQPLHLIPEQPSDISRELCVEGVEHLYQGLKTLFQTMEDAEEYTLRYQDEYLSEDDKFDAMPETGKRSLKSIGHRDDGRPDKRRKGEDLAAEVLMSFASLVPQGQIPGVQLSVGSLVSPGRLGAEIYRGSGKGRKKSIPTAGLVHGMDELGESPMKKPKSNSSRKESCNVLFSEVKRALKLALSGEERQVPPIRARADGQKRKSPFQGVEMHDNSIYCRIMHKGQHVRICCDENRHAFRTQEDAAVAYAMAKELLKINADLWKTLPFF